MAQRTRPPGSAPELKLTLATFGVVLDIEGSERVLTQLLRALPPMAGLGARAGRQYRIAQRGEVFSVAVDGVVSADAFRRDEAVEWVRADIEAWTAEASPSHVFVHAGVVAWRGRAIVVPGASMAGKSTLVASLCRAGAAYLSDEFAVIDARGLIHPYPRPLRLRATRRTLVTLQPEQQGWEVPLEPAPLGAVACVVHGNRERLEAISAGAATLRILEHTVQAQIAPERALDHVRAAVGEARLLTAGTRGEADDFARDLLARCAW